MKYLNYTVLLAVTLMILASCQELDLRQGAQNTSITASITAENTSSPPNRTEPPNIVDVQPTEEVSLNIQNETTRVSAVETQTIKLLPQAFDPEGNQLVFTFSHPFNSSGEWQTKVGDAGDYVVNVTASDGVDEVTRAIRITIKNLNRAPVLGKINDISVLEGETIVVNPLAVDPDGDQLTYEYSGYLTGPRKETGFEDAGIYEASVKVSDGELSDTQKFKIEVINVNRLPVVESVGNIIAVEGDVIEVKPSATDPDGDKLTFSYSGGKFNASGVWATKVGDEGVYDVSLAVSDGQDVVTDTFTVLIQPKNKAPEFVKVGGKAAEQDMKFVVDENSTLELLVEATDPEGDEITYSVSGALPIGSKFNANTRTFSWTPDYETVTGQEGSKDFTVTLKISDGFIEKTLPFRVTVINVNRPPKFLDIKADVK